MPPKHFPTPPWHTTRDSTRTGCLHMQSPSRFANQRFAQAHSTLTSAQAAAMLSQGNPPLSRPPRTSSARPDYNKPPPALPSGRSDLRPNDSYGRGSGSGGYDSRPPPGAYNDPRYDGRQHSPRHDPRYDNSYGSPPPQNYGQAPPPQGYHGRPPIANRPPPTPAPPRDANDRDALWRLFGAVDKDSMLDFPACAVE